MKFTEISGLVISVVSHDWLWHHIRNLKNLKSMRVRALFYFRGGKGL